MQVTTDQGIGISEEHLPGIFGSFFTIRRNLGTGIGLFVATQLAKKHGGTISLPGSPHARHAALSLRAASLPIRTPQNNQPLFIDSYVSTCLGFATFVFE